MAALLHFEEKAEPRRHCRESFFLEQWNQLWLHQHSPELPEPREVPPAPSTSAPSEPVPEAASSDAPPAVPPTVEPPITIPGSEYRVLLASFQTLTTTQTAIMERMDHFQIQQDQQTLILCEIQQHLSLVPPTQPVAVPSSVLAEDPSYPPEEPILLDHTITPLPFFTLLSGGITFSLLLPFAFRTLGTMFILVGGELRK
ncbi:hypothetical protein CK203_061397 [Vitis vinifera]|uniref:Uncharacterized protein n=1 Tax=Vitis vinifera TaxID=29760 RepID=A0A438GAJ6_VITVI|nr:hypothetical protein CK203_061397 [Vitis vinifera]